MPRDLVLCAYDVTSDRRLAAALDAVTGWSHGGQRSVFECLAAATLEAGMLAGEVGRVLAATEDRLALFRPARHRSFTLGLGRLAAPAAIVYVG